LENRYVGLNTISLSVGVGSKSPHLNNCGNYYANAYKEAKTDTITTLQALREEINKMI